MPFYAIRCYATRCTGALQDTSGKIVGINPWHWNTVPYTPGDYWELGVESIPPLAHVWTEIGQAVLKNHRYQASHHLPGRT